MYLDRDINQCNPKQLGIKIKDLEHQEKDYDDFRIKLINLPYWVNISKLNNESNETDTITFSDLETDNLYTFIGEVKYQGLWYGVQSNTFLTQPILERVNKDFSNYISGVISDGIPTPIQGS